MRIFDPKDQLGNSLLSSADTALSSKRLEKQMAVGGGAITLSSADISDIENWELCNASVVENGKTVSFLPETSKDEYGNITVVFGQYFENVVLVLKRVEFGAMCEQEQLTIEVKIRRLMGETVATAGKDGYNANKNIQEWQKLGDEAYESDPVKYRAAEITHWDSKKPPFALGTTVEESFLSLQTTSLYAFAGNEGVKEWYSDLPCLRNVNNSPFVVGPIEIFEADMPNLVDGSSMFHDCTHLTSFRSEMPSLTNCDDMFWGCSALESFSTPSGTLPNSITNAGAMFWGCNGLKSWTVALPNNLIEATSMFMGCTGLKSWTIALPNSITNAQSMFADCSGLTSWNVELPNGLTNASLMFNDCSGLKSWTVALPDSLTNVSGMFWGCTGLTSWSVALPNSITSASDMFRGCSGLNSWTVVLPNSLTHASSMFSGCSGLTSWSVALPNSLTDASSMFSSCTGLTSWSVALPNSLTTASYMFSGCKGLTSWTVALPNSITDAGGMFSGCTKLTSWSVALPNSITNASSMFSGCTGLTSWSVALPNSLTNAKSMFYGCSGLTSFSTPSGTLPNTITQAGGSSQSNGMFSGCSNLESFTVSMPTGLTKKARYMFYGCKLDLASVKKISETIQSCTGTSATDKTFTLGIAKSLEGNTEVQGYLQDIRNQGWTVEVTYRA